MSSDCVDLIGLILQREPEARASLETIRHHPWMKHEGQEHSAVDAFEQKSGCPPTALSSMVSLAGGDLNASISVSLDRNDRNRILDKMAEHSFDRDVVVDALEKGTYDYMTATYYLFAEGVIAERAKRNRGEGTIRQMSHQEEGSPLVNRRDQPEKGSLGGLRGHPRPLFRRGETFSGGELQPHNELNADLDSLLLSPRPFPGSTKLPEKVKVGAPPTGSYDESSSNTNSPMRPVTAMLTAPRGGFSAAFLRGDDPNSSWHAPGHEREERPESPPSMLSTSLPLRRRGASLEPTGSTPRISITGATNSPGALRDADACAASTPIPIGSPLSERPPWNGDLALMRDDDVCTSSPLSERMMPSQLQRSQALYPSASVTDDSDSGDLLAFEGVVDQRLARESSGEGVFLELGGSDEVQNFDEESEELLNTHGQQQQEANPSREFSGGTLSPLLQEEEEEPADDDSRNSSWY